MGIGPKLHAGRRRTSGLGAGCPASREALDVRAGGPDVWPGVGQDFCLLWKVGAGFPGETPDVRPDDAAPDVRARGRMSGPWAALGCSFAAAAGRISGPLAGYPDAVGFSRFLPFPRSRHLLDDSVFSCIFAVVSFTPDQA